MADESKQNVERQPHQIKKDTGLFEQIFPDIIRTISEEQEDSHVAQEKPGTAAERALGKRTKEYRQENSIDHSGYGY
jgi:hypothetical protein